MKKFIFKPTGEEIKIGATISFLFIPEFINAFKNMGIIDEEIVFEPSVSLQYYREKLAKRLGLNISDYYTWEEISLKSRTPIVFLSLLKEVALEFDQKYKGHISDSKEWWIVSIDDGKVYECKTKPTHYYVSIFRSKADAETACKILSPYIEAYYGEQKNKKCLS